MVTDGRPHTRRYQMREFRRVVEAISQAAGNGLQSVGRWRAVGEEETDPPAFTAHVVLDGHEFLVAVLPTKGNAPEE